jgi:intracellular septation protein A
MKRGRNPLLTLLVDLAAPIGLYYALHAAGVGNYLALLLSAVVPASSSVVQFVRRRRLDSFGLFVMSMIVLSVGASLITGSTRFLLAKDGWFTGVTGLWFFASMAARHPISYICAKPLLEGRIGPKGVPWDTLWDELPLFRRAWRVINVIWGVAMQLDAAVRIVMAYTLPVDLVPGLGGAQYAVLFVLLQVITTVCNMRAGVYDPRSAVYAPLTSRQQLSDRSAL